MPNRILREGINSSAARYIPIALKFKLWAMPCVVCSDEGDIEIDHIIPVIQGGTRDESNLQPLCFQCHKRKGPKTGRSNEELRELYLLDTRKHHLFAQYRKAHRYVNSFEWPNFDQWLWREGIAL